MKTIYEGLIRLCQNMEEDGLHDRVVDLDEVKKMTRDEEEDNERPLYRAKPSAVPGTWTDADGELIKTSKD